jgi:hypothetical protein
MTYCTKQFLNKLPMTFFLVILAYARIYLGFDHLSYKMLMTNFLKNFFKMDSDIRQNDKFVYVKSIKEFYSYSDRIKISKNA